MFESLLARWPEERFDLLQPDTPSVHFILIFLSVEQVKDVAAKKEAWSSHMVEMIVLWISRGGRGCKLYEGWSSRAREHEGGGGMICNSASSCYM